MLNKPVKKVVIIQLIVLSAGTIFAWVNFSLELADWLNQKGCQLGCSLEPTTNPFFTPCFFGALFFSAALILNILILKKLCQDLKT